VTGEAVKVMNDAPFITMIMVILTTIAAVFALMGRKRPGGLGVKSEKYPPVFSSTLSQAEIVNVVEERLKQMTSIRSKWKVQDKVERIGRLQAMLTVAYDLAGDDIKISFLVNLLATAKPAGGCNVEWSYVMMAPISKVPPEIELWENNIYKQTTLEIRGALFAAQGDLEVAEFVQDQARAVAPKPATVEPREKHAASAPGAEEAMKVKVPKEKPEPQPAVDPQPEPLQQIESSTQSEVSTNTLNFSPPDLNLVANIAGSAESKCIKCSQARDPSFSFCLYCGHADA
jgi:hypothetical protein